MNTFEQLPQTNDLNTELIKFCGNQIHTQENSEGYDCAIRLVEGARLVECPYVSAEHARKGVEFFGPYTGGPDHVCRDFKAMEDTLEIPDNIILGQN